jgi:hypothetical protein
MNPKFDIYQKFRAWLLLFLIADAIVITVNGSQEVLGDAPPLTLVVTAAFMLYVPILIIDLFKNKILPSFTVVSYISVYVLGILLVSLSRDDVASELPRAVITAISIWGGLVLGTCIGSSSKILKIFLSTLLFFGVTISIASILAGIGSVSSLNVLEIGRGNRIWTIAFGIVDPVCMFGSGLFLISQYFKSFNLPTKIVHLILVFLALLLILYSSTRSYLIQLGILFVFTVLSRTGKPLRSIVVPTIIILSVVIVTFITQASDLSNISILNQFGFVDASGSISLEKSRSRLHEYLIEKSFSSPILGVGINEIKQSTASIDDAAKTEYGYYLHGAAFGYIVAFPFYLIMLLGGFLRPLLYLAKLPKKALIKTFSIHGMAVGCFLAGFNGYYAQATAVAQFISLIFIGISIQLDSPSKEKVHLVKNENEDLLHSQR